MDKEKKLTKIFFDESGRRYFEFAFNEKSKDLHAKIKEIIDGEIYGNKVIDLGGGGVVRYEVTKASFFVSFDISYQMLKKSKDRRHIHLICGDVENLPFKNGVFNRVICGWLLHHLVRVDAKKSGRFLSKVLFSIFKILEDEGRIIIIENCLPKIFERIQNLMLPLLRIILELFGKPAVKFLSYSSIGNLLKKMGFKDIVVIPLKEKKNWGIVPLGIILPFLKVPQKLVPTNIYIIMGKKV